MAQLDSDSELDNAAKTFDAGIFGKVAVNGIKPLKMVLSSTERRLSSAIGLDAVLRYAAPSDMGMHAARVQKHAEF
jgi:hypothetical protein